MSLVPPVAATTILDSLHHAPLRAGVVGGGVSGHRAPLRISGSPQRPSPLAAVPFRQPLALGSPSPFDAFFALAVSLPECALAALAEGHGATWCVLCGEKKLVLVANVFLAPDKCSGEELYCG